MAIVTEQRSRLNSWKEIADFLGVSVRAAQRWEAERGLPVYRLPGHRGPVYAEIEELRDWLRSKAPNGDTQEAERENGKTGKGIPEVPAGITRRGGQAKAFSAALLFLALAGACIWWVWFQPGPPALWSFSQQTLIVSDQQGRELWRRSFSEPLNEKYYRELRPGTNAVPQFVDIDGDGEVEVLFEEQALIPGTHPDALSCFSSRGSLKWRYVPGKPVATTSTAYRSNFDILNFVAAPMGAGRRYSILAIATHYPNHICQVALLSADGRRQREYWHSGHIGLPGSTEIADRNHDGRSEIYLGGVNNGSSKQATLVVLDPEAFEGGSAEEDPAEQWVDLPPGREMARVLFPRSCVNHKEQAYNFVSGLSWDSDRLVVHVHETYNRESTLTYYLDAALKPMGVTISDVFREKHQQMELDKKIDHSLREQETAALSRLQYPTPPHLD